MMYHLLSLLAVSTFFPSALVSSSPILPSRADAAALEERYYPQGTISSPANGTSIMPGETFDFYYNQRGDYCLSSMNFTVWLVTNPPRTDTSVLGLMGAMGDETEVTGWYFGRFAYSGSGNEFPPNPAPSQLTMPDFSKPMGGFSSGESVSSKPMYLTVLEEWNSCDPTLGHRLSLTANTIVYNATNTTSSPATV